MKKAITFIGIIIVVMVVFTIISKQSGTNQEQKKYLTIKGSDTMVHLITNWAEKYMEVHPNVDISVTGGGSGTGIAALINNTTDIAAASRNMKNKEINQAKKRNVIPVEHTVARDGIAIVVNPENPLNEITMEALKKIYTGKYTNWIQVKGIDKKIVVLSRESSSGTYVFFQECILNKENYVSSAMLMPSTSSIIQSIQADKESIGYVGLGYAEKAKGKVKVLKIKKDIDSSGVIPSQETVKSGEYPISRPLFLYTVNSMMETNKNFIDFVQSEAGQEIVKNEGYIPVQ